MRHLAEMVLAIWFIGMIIFLLATGDARHAIAWPWCSTHDCPSNRVLSGVPPVGPLR